MTCAKLHPHPTIEEIKTQKKNKTTTTTRTKVERREREKKHTHTQTERKKSYETPSKVNALSKCRKNGKIIAKKTSSKWVEKQRSLESTGKFDVASANDAQKKIVFVKKNIQ